VQECVLHIELVDRPAARECQGEDCPDRSWLDHWSKSLIVVDPGLPSKPAKDPTGFVSLQGPINVELVPENPLPGDDVVVGWLLYQFPSVIGQQGAVLFPHGAAPVRISKSVPNRRGIGESCWMERAAAADEEDVVASDDVEAAD
jgi:hypothetical protein